MLSDRRARDGVLLGHLRRQGFELVRESVGIPGGGTVLTRAAAPFHGIPKINRILARKICTGLGVEPIP